MKIEHMQKISDLVDDYEVHDQAFWATLSSDAELQECWRRYHLIGETLRRDAATHPGFPERVMNCVRMEPALSGTSGGSGGTSGSLGATIIAFPAWTRRVAGWAIAASVAIMVVSLLPKQQADQSSIETVQANSSPSVPAAIANSNMANSNMAAAAFGGRGSPHAPLLSQAASPVYIDLPDINKVVSEFDSEHVEPPVLYSLDQYMVKHSAAASVYNTLPYARIVDTLSDK